METREEVKSTTANNSNGITDSIYEPITCAARWAQSVQRVSPSTGEWLLLLGAVQDVRDNANIIYRRMADVHAYPLGMDDRRRLDALMDDLRRVEDDILRGFVGDSIRWNMLNGNNGASI